MPAVWNSYGRLFKSSGKNHIDMRLPLFSSMSPTVRSEMIDRRPMQVDPLAELNGSNCKSEEDLFFLFERRIYSGLVGHCFTITIVTSTQHYV